MIAFWLVGNWLLFMIGSYMIMICEIFGLFQQKTAKRKRKNSSQVNMVDLLNDHGGLLHDHCKNNCKIKSDHIVTHLKTTVTYNQNSRLNCSHKLRTTCGHDSTMLLPGFRTQFAVQLQ